MDRLSQLFPDDIRFSYACLDRLVIRGYYPGLQREENIVHFLRDVVGASAQLSLSEPHNANKIHVAAPVGR